MWVERIGRFGAMSVALAGPVLPSDATCIAAVAPFGFTPLG